MRASNSEERFTRTVLFYFQKVKEVISPSLDFYRGGHYAKFASLNEASRSRSRTSSSSPEKKKPVAITTEPSSERNLFLLTHCPSRKRVDAWPFLNSSSPATLVELRPPQKLSVKGVQVGWKHPLVGSYF